MDAPEELRRVLADAMAAADANQEFTYPELADAVLAVPAIADALARDAKVAEWARQGADGGVMQNVLPIAALYPEAGKP